jgi:hypothetical protein
MLSLFYDLIIYHDKITRLTEWWKVESQHEIHLISLT